MRATELRPEAPNRDEKSPPAAATQAQREKWRGRGIRVRLRVFSRVWVDTPYHSPVLGHVDQLVESVKAAGESRGMLVCCEPGGGKTALTRQLQRRYRTTVTVERTMRQMALMELPKLMSHPELTKALLRCIGDPSWDGVPRLRTFTRALELTRRSGIKLLVVDNFQDIPERRNLGRVRVVGNWFRDLHDGTNIAWVALGTADAKKVREANDQVRRRMPSVHTIPYFSYGTDVALQAWLDWISKIWAALPLAETKDRVERLTASRLLLACNGIPDYLIRLLKSAVTVAVSRGSENLSWDDLAAAFVDIAGDVVPTGNPFMPDYHGGALNRVDELFFNMEEDQRRARQKDDRS